MAQRYRDSSNPPDASVAQAFQKLQQRWRDGVQGTAPGAMQQLDRLNTARSGLYPMEDAMKKATGNTGQFTPTQLAQAMNRDGGSFGQGAADLNRAGRELLNNNRPLGRTLSRNSLGFGFPGAATVAHLAGVPGMPAAAAIGAGATAAGAGVAAALNSQKGIDILVHGMGGLLPKETRLYVASLPPAQAAQYLDSLAQRYPHLAPGYQAALAQVGRAYSTRQQGVTQ